MKSHLFAAALALACATPLWAQQLEPPARGKTPAGVKPEVPAGQLLADLLLSAQEKKVLQHRLFTKRYYRGYEGANAWLLVGSGSSDKDGGFRFTMSLEIITRGQSVIGDYRFDPTGHLKSVHLRATRTRSERESSEELTIRIVDGVATQTASHNGKAKDKDKAKSGPWTGDRISLFSTLVLLTSLGDLGLPQALTVGTCGEDDDIGKEGNELQLLTLRRKTLTTDAGKRVEVLVEGDGRRRPMVKVLLGTGKDQGVIREVHFDPRPDGSADIKLTLIDAKEAAEMRKHAPQLRNEAKAVSALRSIHYAQRRFKQERKAQGKEEFAASLEALEQEKVLHDKGLAEGTSDGYLILLRRSADGQRWMAVAVPEEPGISGRYYFVTDTEGKAFRSKKEIQLKESCTIPAGLEAVDR